MEMLYPLGLVLGIIGIVVLIIIYLIKPNFQQKVISSTIVWKWSFKYRRKRIPINRFRNLLILLCQILILAMAAFLIARPFLPNALEHEVGERIAIIDASASMLAQQGEDETRFERAVLSAKNLGTNAINKGERFSVILADSKAHSIILRTESLNTLNTELDKLLEPNAAGFPSGCSFVSADIDGAMLIAEDYLKQNPSAEVTLFTATEYEKPRHVKVENVAKLDDSENKEWNAAILDCTTEVNENYFRFSIQVASYNEDKDIEVYLLAYGVNGALPSEAMKEPAMAVAECRDNNIVTVRFNSLKINTYSSVYIYINEDDSFGYDNFYYLYGGVKEELKVVYVTPAASNFYKGLLSSLRYSLASRWDITSASIVSLAEIEESGNRLVGYDLYIFEYFMPDILPEDGVVIMLSPNKAPRNSGLVLGEEHDMISTDSELCRLYQAEPSQLLNYIDPSNIVVNVYTEVISYDGYKPLMYFKSDYGNNPVYLVKNDPTQKIAVLTYSTLYSDYSMVAEFPTLLFNLMEVLFPATIKNYVYDVGERVVFDQNDYVLYEARPELQAMGGWSIEPKLYDNGVYDIRSEVPGNYSISQQKMSKDFMTENYFVKIAAFESDFTKTAVFRVPVVPERELGDFDIYIFFAIVLSAAIFLERILHARDEF